MQYSITDVVEVGHSKFTGASIDVTFIWNDVVDMKRFRESNIPQLSLKLIDCLDHALITDDERFIPHSYRHFLLDKSEDLFLDTHSTLFAIAKTEEKFQEVFNSIEDIIIKCGKESYSSKFAIVSSQKLIKYSIEG